MSDCFKGESDPQDASLELVGVVCVLEDDIFLSSPHTHLCTSDLGKGNPFDKNTCTVVILIVGHQVNDKAILFPYYKGETFLSLRLLFMTKLNPN